MKTQLQLYWEAERRLAARNQAFMDAVNEGMTSDELEKIIKRRPEVWGIYADWVKILKERESNKGN